MGRKKQRDISRRRHDQQGRGEGGDAQPPSTNRGVVRPTEHEDGSRGQASEDRTRGGQRWLVVADLADLLGGVTPRAVRQWGTQGKLPLRRLFGDSGPLGMSEGEFSAFLSGGGTHGKSDS